MSRENGTELLAHVPSKQQMDDAIADAGLDDDEDFSEAVRRRRKRWWWWSGVLMLTHVFCLLLSLLVVCVFSAPVS
jgi:hypothetical protein